MYFKYPYSDMYALNLDWMIKAINEVQEIISDLGTVVNSVNGESGDVTISAEMVNATNINSTLVTNTDPSTQTQSVLESYYENGIRVILVRNNIGVIDRCFFLSKNDSVYNLVEYVPTGSQSGVRIINGLTGDVTLTGENVTLSSVDQRTIAVVIAALTNRVGTVESSVGDLSELETYDKASLVAAINELVQTDTTIFEDIGDISELDVEAGNLVAAVNINTAQIASLQNGLAYVENGNNATLKTYTAGEFLVWKGILYTVNSGGIPLGNPISGHVTAVGTGGLNALKANIDSVTAFTNQQTPITIVQGGTAGATIPNGVIYSVVFGHVVHVTYVLWNGAIPDANNDQLVVLLPFPASASAVRYYGNIGYSNTGISGLYTVITSYLSDKVNHLNFVYHTSSGTESVVTGAQISTKSLQGDIWYFID